MQRLHVALGSAWLLTAVVSAQEVADQVFEQLAQRVASVRPGGGVVVDRGSVDHVQVGDRVFLAPRNGPMLPGSVQQVDERTALVSLQDPAALVPIGCRGHVLVPKVRTRGAAPPTTTDDVPPAPAQGPPADAPADDGWRPGMPLLGPMRAPRPAERPASLHGRVYGRADAVRTLDSFRQSWFASGVDFALDNPQQDGGSVNFHGEFLHSTEGSGDAGADLRLYEFSYQHGGSRFEPLHWQVGRFLSRDVPELGLLDGGTIGYRREGGDRFGASFGYLPELDDDMESFADLQLAAWYTWNLDAAERSAVLLAFQHTWHRGTADRDLVLLRTRYLPHDGFDVLSTWWIDLYDGRDDRKAAVVEITRANVSVARRLAGGSGIELAFDHESYPDIDRRELAQTVLPTTLADAHHDRVLLHGYWQADAATRWFVRATGFVDAERTGGSIEGGVAGHGWLQDGATTTVAGFVIAGVTSSLHGVRLEHGGAFAGGRLDGLYELGFVHHEGFPADRDDLLQHRLGGVWTRALGGGWDATCHGDVTLWDDELSFGVGIYLQRIF
ncbi:MAG: hypothetical protein JNN13_13945 [Planctomycetes bacterium]|nr:hypothetical protein [Planctomycetota bacterium]